MEKIDSQVFGGTTLLDEDDAEMAELRKLIEQFPASVFGVLNKTLNEKGLCLSVAKLE